MRRASTFDGGAIYYTGSTGAHAIWGALITPYLDHGGPTSHAAMVIGNHCYLIGGVDTTNDPTAAARIIERAELQ